MIIIDGVPIFVKKLSGKSDLNFVLIHNAGGDHRFFIHQCKVLRKFGNVFLIDLPGSGKSKPISTCGKIENLSSLVIQLCTQLSLQNICLIGLNNGANICIEIALHYSIKKLILIDPPIFIGKDFKKEILAYIKALGKEDPDHLFSSSLVKALFIHTDPKNKQIALDAFNKADKKTLQHIFKNLLEWDAKSVGLLKKISAPTLCILTDEHHCSYEKMQREAPQFEIGKVIGSKCWATLEVPEQTNAMIHRFLTIP